MALVDGNSLSDFLRLFGKFGKTVSQNHLIVFQESGNKTQLIFDQPNISKAQT